MNRHISDFPSFSRLASILSRTKLIGLLIVIIVTGFFLLTESAEMQSYSVSSKQNLILGRLAYSESIVGPGTDSRIGTVNPDGSEQTRIPVTSSFQPSEPDWSPDGTKLVFSTNQNPFDIFVINEDGSGETNLTNNGFEAFDRDPSWSVAGKIAYARRNTQSNSPNEIWTMNEDGSGQAHFSDITQPSPTDPAWSPDGTKLAFVSGGDIWLINADGTNQQQLTATASVDTDLAWSPDGLKIVFAKAGSGISVINAEGSNETPLTNVSSDKEPAWSPDGIKIAFRRDGLYTMDADGGNQVRIIADFTNFPNCCDHLFGNPSWQPVSQEPNTYVINGRVTDNYNLPVSGVTVNLSGAINAATTTDAVGIISFQVFRQADNTPFHHLM